MASPYDLEGVLENITNENNTDGIMRWIDSFNGIDTIKSIFELTKEAFNVTSESLYRLVVHLSNLSLEFDRQVAIISGGSLDGLFTPVKFIANFRFIVGDGIFKVYYLLAFLGLSMLIFKILLKLVSMIIEFIRWLISLIPFIG